MNIEIKGLKQSFQNDTNILDCLDLQIKSNESFVVIGGSGSGKTVLLEHIIANHKQEDGSILIDNTYNDIFIKDHLGKIGILFQEIGLFDWMTLQENVAFYLTETLKEKNTSAHKKANKYLREVGIQEQYFTRYPNEISLGMSKRVGFARTLIKQPSLLMLDEPTSGLDPISSNKISLLIKDTISKIDTTTFTITHDLHLAYTIADRIGLLKNGKFSWIGTPKELIKTKNKNVIEFLESTKLE